MKSLGVSRWIIVGMLTVAAVSATAQEFVVDGLIAHYTFDKASIKGAVAADAMGKHDGKISGNPKSVAGKIGEAIDLNGTTDFIEIPKLGDEKAVSVEAWAHAREFGSIRGIVSTFGGGEWKAGTVHFKFESNQIQAHKNDGVKIVAPAAINTWYHIVYTSDTGANELKLYVDGAFVIQGVAGATANNLNAMRVGSEHDGRYLNGMVDEVRIYKRILTEKEVAQNYKAKSNSLAVQPNGKATVTWGTLRTAN